MTPTNYQQNIQDIIDAMPDMIIVMHRDGTILEIHGEDQEKLIMPADELIGTSIKTCFNEDEFNRHISMYEQCIANNENRIITFELIIKGKTLHFESRIKPLDNERLLTIVRDISEQKQLIEAHEEELAFRKFLFENDNNGLVIFNYEHKVIDVNPQFCRMTGYSADELKTMFTWDFDALSTKKDIIENFNINKDFERTFTSRHRRKDGSTYDVEVSAISFHWQGEWFVYCSCRDISERNIISQDLLNTKANLTAIVENTLDSIWSINKKYEITYINDVFTDAFNAAFGVLLKPGVNLLESLPAAIQPKWKTRYDTVLCGERILFEDVIETRDFPIYIEIAANPIIQNNEVIGASLFGRNITDRKQTEQIIAKNQKDLMEINRIGLIANSTLDLDALLDLILKSVVKTLNAQVGMIFLKDPDQNQFKWGASLGLSEAFITDFKNRPIRFGEGLTGTIAKTGEPIYIPENSSNDSRVVRSVINKEGLNSFIGVPVFAGDEVIGIMNILTRPPALLSKDNLHTCAAIGSQIGLAIRNASLFEERKIAQEAVQKSNQRLESLLKISRQITSNINQEEIMQMIVDNAIRIVGLETGAVYLKKDEATIKLSATSPALPGNFPDDLRIALLSDHPHIGKAMETGKQVLLADSSSAKLTPEEQKIIDLRKLKTTLYLPIQIRGKTIGVLILSSTETPRIFTNEELNLLQGFANQAAHIIDNVRNYAELKKHAIELEAQIRHREEAERDLIDAKENAEESNRLKTAFINNISHEVRTPLNGILGFGHLIMKEGLSSSEKQDYFNLLQHSSDRLQQTITDIVDISEIRAGTIKPGKQDVPLAQLINKLMEKTREACSKKNILVTPEVPPQHKNLVLQTDEELFVKIMNQLLSNAEKFTASGRISLGYDVQDKWVHFYVRDTGQGISTDKLNLMFEPFMQEDVSVTRGHEGSGLGLSIARGLVELLGGKLWAESKKGEGSTFFFTLPLLTAELKTESAEPPVVQPTRSGNNLVLIAEDEESNYMLLKTVAERAGFSTLHAIHGAEAVELCHQYPEIGLILMDIKMPVMNGLLATKHIKSFRPDLPIIALTAHAQTGDRQRMIDAGCDEYLTKPVKVQELQRLIREMIV